MKFTDPAGLGVSYGSCPSRGTWIEIGAAETRCSLCSRSCPSRGTWIEIIPADAATTQGEVVPLAGHVD